MERFSFTDKLRYKFDNIMARGAIALVGVLFLITAVVIIIAGIIAFLLGNGSISENVWASIMHTIDAGTITGTDTGNIPFIILMSVVTLCGLFVTSILIGIITTGFEEKLQSLKKGNSRVIENNHTVILGFNDSVYTIISELIVANENKKDGCIVILAPEDKEEMETSISEHIDDFKTTRVICRTGNITDFHMLRQCSIDTCRSIIINEDRDFITTKAILAINTCVKELSDTPVKAHIVATVSDIKNYEASQIAGEGNVELILIQDAVSRIIAQTCRQPGLSNVLIELFDYSGDELYFETFPQLAGRSFGEAMCMFEHAVVFGYKRNGNIRLNPLSDTILKEDDSLILLVEDDGMAKPLAEPPNLNGIEELISDVKLNEDPENILIIGINGKLEKIIVELDNYFMKGSKVVVANDEIPSAFQIITEKLTNISVEFIECDTSNRTTLDNLTEGKIDHVLLLSNDELESETCDAITLLKLIHLRDIAKKMAKSFNITSEMKNASNQRLARVANVNDLVVGSNIVNLILTQISENRDLSTVFKELLHADGSEIYIRSAVQYIKPNKIVDFYQITEIARRRGEIAIGYKKQSGNSFTIVNGPAKSEKISFTEQDSIVVLAND